MRKNLILLIAAVILLFIFMQVCTFKDFCSYHLNIWLFLFVFICYIISGVLQFPLAKKVNFSMIPYFIMLSFLSFGPFYTLIMVIPGTFFYKNLHYSLLKREKLPPNIPNIRASIWTTLLTRSIEVLLIGILILKFIRTKCGNYPNKELTYAIVIAVSFSVLDMFLLAFNRFGLIRFLDFFRIFFISMIAWLISGYLAYQSFSLEKQNGYVFFIFISIMVIIINWTLFKILFRKRQQKQT